MDLTLSSPRGDGEILKAFETASAIRFAGEAAAMEDALVACTQLHHAGWNVLAIVRRDDEPVGWVGWVPEVGDKWVSLVQVRGVPDPSELAPPLLCWLAHSGDRLRAQHGAGVLESLFTPWEDRLAVACSAEMDRRRWDARRPVPRLKPRWDATVRGPVEALDWTNDSLPHRCLRPTISPRPEQPLASA